MSRQLFLGIDMGTGSTRVALVDTLGKVVASHSHPHELVTPRHGWAEQDPDDWWAAVVEGIHAVLESASAQPNEILALAVDSQMHATIPISASGELLSHGVQLWCDKRGSGLVEEFNGRPEISRAIQIAGSPPVGAWVGFKILWLKTFQPELYAHTWKFLTGAGLINYRLTGELSIDWTEASGTFLMDAGTCQWSAELGEILGLDLDKLPPIYRSADVVGHVTRDAAHLTGLAEGTPICAGGGDMLIMLLAAGLAEQGRALDITGTASNLVFYVPAPVTDPPLMNLHHPLPGWCPFGITESGGGSLKWLRDNLARSMTSQVTGQGKAYDLLIEEASHVNPGAEGLLYMPYLMGERVLGSPNSRGAFVGLTPRSSLGSMVRAVMEGVTFELRRTLEIVEGAGNRIEAVIHTGGGARSPLWSQIKADIYHKPVYTLAIEEGGVLGSAILAMAGSGYDPDVPAAARRCVQLAHEYKPEPANFTLYDRLFQVFKEVHDGLQAPYNHLAEMV